MSAPAGSAAAFREARRGKPTVTSSRQASLANMRELIAADEADLSGDAIVKETVGSESMKRELAKLGLEPTR